MNVASLDLCKELYAESEWGDSSADQTNLCWAKKDEKATPRLIRTEEGRSWPTGYWTAWPAYDLSYLLRKLPARLPKDEGRISWNLCLWKTLKDLDGNTHYGIDYIAGVTERQYFGSTKLEADTPEDVACKLAIELFKLGILKCEV